MKVARTSLGLATLFLASSALAAGSVVGEVPQYPANRAEVQPEFTVIQNAAPNIAGSAVTLGESPNYPGATNGIDSTSPVVRDVPTTQIGALPDYPGERISVVEHDIRG